VENSGKKCKFAGEKKMYHSIKQANIANVSNSLSARARLAHLGRSSPLLWLTDRIIAQLSSYS
jgi:hypothetical protein